VLFLFAEEEKDPMKLSGGGDEGVIVAVDTLFDDTLLVMFSDMMMGIRINWCTRSDVVISDCALLQQKR
jgi:hypothetical protein